MKSITITTPNSPIDVDYLSDAHTVPMTPTTNKHHGPNCERRGAIFLTAHPPSSFFGSQPNFPSSTIPPLLAPPVGCEHQHQYTGFPKRPRSGSSSSDSRDHPAIYSHCCLCSGCFTGAGLCGFYANNFFYDSRAISTFFLC